MSHVTDAVQEVHLHTHTDEVLSRRMAVKYRSELSAQKANGGTGTPLDNPAMVRRIVSLRRRNASLAPRHREADSKTLVELEKRLPSHITAEADRVIGVLSAEIRAVGGSVAALRDEVREARQDLRALVRGELQL